ncbi:MAG TPA: transglutaminase domain-containing protein [Clostridiaceae bacterium]|nr:transglutaminase domain-containing protein [Clostridiaceae bacterium]
MGFNAVTVLLAAVFLIPLAAGAARGPSRRKMLDSMGSLLDNVELLAGFLLSVYLTKKIFFENNSGVFALIYKWIPGRLKDFLYGRDVLTYILIVPIILLFVLLILRIFTTPFYRHVIEPLSEAIYRKTCEAGRFIRSLTGALWQLPKAILGVLVCTLILNFSGYYFYMPKMAKWMSESGLYQLIYQNALHPILNSNIAKQIPVIVNDSFRNLTGGADQNGETIVEQIGKRIIGDAVIIEYFNGVTIDEAIKSTPEIDRTAAEIVGDEESDTKKAYLIYKWVSKNIEYDFEKAENIVYNTWKYKSGSIEAFNTRKGICFDYSCLYISMCRAVGLKVRLITGLGYSGTSWGDHAWNQVWSEEEQRWINLDTTFGSSGKNYFDKPDFFVDHRDGQIQGEW